MLVANFASGQLFWVCGSKFAKWPVRSMHPYAPETPALRTKGLHVASARSRSTGTATKGPPYQAWVNGWRVARQAARALPRQRHIAMPKLLGDP